MYMGTFLEDVNSINMWYTCIILPNLPSTSFFMVYSYVLRWTTILVFNENIR
jgi:hypothetical protein